MISVILYKPTNCVSLRGAIRTGCVVKDRMYLIIERKSIPFKFGNKSLSFTRLCKYAQLMTINMAIRDKV